MINIDTTQQLSRRYRSDNFTIVREYLQLLFLKYFYQSPKANKVYFKGGTAIHFIYKSFRFSEDLDFTSTVDETTTSRLVQQAFDNFVQEATRVELEEQDSSQGLKFRIKHFPPEISQALPIRLDFSFREEPRYTDVTAIETDFPVIPYPLVSHLKAKELLAEKVRALLVRGQPRDVFDLWFLLSKGTPLELKLIDEKLKIYPDMQIKDLKGEIIERVHKVPQAELKQDLNQFLPENYRDFYKKLPNLVEKQIIEMGPHGSKNLP